MSHVRRYWWIVVLVALAAALEIFGVLAEAEGSAVRITVSNPVGPGMEGRTYGSGTVIDRDDQGALVLTCAHLFRDGAGKIYVCAGEHGCSAAKLVAQDTTYDLAALEIGPLAVQPAAIAAQAPAPGEMVYACGYGPDGRYQRLPCRALGYARTQNQSTRETLMTTGAARDGDSGGPVYNQAGQLVGVLWGTDGHEIGATCCTRIRTFLQGLRGRFRGRGGQFGTTPAPPATSPAAPLVPVQPVTPGGSQPATPSIPALLERLDRAMQELEAFRGQADRLQTIEEQLGQVEGLQERLDAALSDDRLGQVVGDQVGPILDKLPATGESSKSGWLLTLWSVLQALGWTTAPSAGVVGAVWLILRFLRWRRSRRSQQTSEGGSAPAAEPVPVVVREDPRPQQPLVRRNREFVEVEVPERRLKALQMAHDEYVKRHPAARAVIETLEAFADQFESAMQ